MDRCRCGAPLTSRGVCRRCDPAGAVVLPREKTIDDGRPDPETVAQRIDPVEIEVAHVQWPSLREQVRESMLGTSLAAIDLSGAVAREPGGICECGKPAGHKGRCRGSGWPQRRALQRWS